MGLDLRKKLFAIGLLALALDVPREANAEDRLDFALFYPTDGQVGMTRMECIPKEYREKTGPVACTFHVTRVIPPPSHIAQAAELTSALIWALSGKPKDYAEMCSEIDETRVRTPRQLKWLADMKQACTTTAVRENVLRVTVALGAESLPFTCKLDSNTFTAEFRRIDANTWISNDGPSGMCNRVQTITLTREKSDSPLWKYKEVRVVPERGGPNKETLCEPGTTVYEMSGINNPDEVACHFWRN